jgi:hypothetical protein
LDPRALRSASACAILTVACWLSVIRAASAAAPDGGAIAGRVSDQTGAPLQGVAVSLTGQRHDSVVASATGEYRFDTLPAGRYALIFDFPGFAQQSRTGIAVIAGAVSRIDVVLQVSLHAEVSVTGKRTFRSFAEVDPSELSLVGLAPSASVGVVTSRQLEHRPIQRAADVLETIPGMAVTQHTGEGKATQYYLRGFNLDHGTDFATTVAGVPVNMPTHAHGHGYTDAGFLIPELVTGVQYFKGPYSADAGDFSSAGGATINYASQLDAPMLRVSAGGQGWARVLAAASPRVGSGQLLAAAELAHSDGPWTQPDDYRRYNAVLRYTRGDAANNLVLGALAYRGSWHSTDQAPQRAINDGMLPRFGAVDPTTGGDTGRYAASAEWQRTSSASRNRLTGYAVAYDLDLFSNFTYFLDDPVEGDQFHQADRRLVSGLRASHERLALAGERPVEYRVGAQVRRDDIGRVGLYRTRARQRLSTVREDAVHQISAGIWADADVRWTPWLRSAVGVRGDQYWFQVDSNRRENSGTAAAGLVSPKGSLVLGPWRRTELYFNAGMGFHSNDARGATMTIDPATGLRAAGVTPLARTRGAEVGARTVAFRGVQSTVAVWRLSLDSELVFVGDAGATAPSRPSVRRGIEWSTFARLRPWLSLDADLAWSRARFTDGDPAGPFVPGAAERVVSFGLTANGSHATCGSVRWRYFGPRPLTEDGSVWSRHTSLVNAQAGYRLSRRYSFVVDAFNVLNARHSDVDYFYTSRLPDEPLSGVDDVHTHPAPPRTVRLAFSVAF